MTEIKEEYIEKIKVLDRADCNAIVRHQYNKSNINELLEIHDLVWLKKQAFDSVPDSETDPNSEQPVYFKKDVELHLKYLYQQRQKQGVLKNDF